MSRVCFDIETEQFSQEFLEAKSRTDKLKHAPRMRIACVYFEKTGKYRFYLPDKAPELVAALQAASEVVTFNGKGFDVLVLRKHHGLRGRFPLRGKHVDVHEIMTAHARFRVSLHVASKLNLKEGKHTSGRAMSEVVGKALQAACKSDVSQTWRLWKLHSQGALEFPWARASSAGSDGEWRGGPGSFMSEVCPDVCPSCLDVDSLEFVDWDNDDDDMTDGQMAEYLAGTQGSAACTTCGFVLNWFF